MLKTIYEVSVHHEDYFDHFRSTIIKPDVEVFDSLIKAFIYYKDSKAKDFCWPGDHKRYTSRPVRKVIFVDENKQECKHGYVRGHSFSWIFDRVEDKYSQYKKYRPKYDNDGLMVLDSSDDFGFEEFKFEDDDIDLGF